MNREQLLWSRIRALEERLEMFDAQEHAPGSVVEPFLLLPGLRGFWPMSAFDSSGNAQDVSGHGHHLTRAGNPNYAYTAHQGLAPFLIFDGAGDYLSRTDEADLDITGTETHVAASYRGLTFGGWFRFANSATVIEACMSKWLATGNQLSYAIRRSAAGNVLASVSADGSAVVSATSTATISTGAWHFLAARFDPSTELALFEDDAQYTNTTSIPASIYSGTANFTIGGHSGGTSLFTGYACLFFLCAAAVSDAAIAHLYQRTRVLFGV